MPACRLCGAEIVFKITTNGKYMPCEKKLARALPLPRGREEVLTMDGRLIKAEFVQPDHPGSAWVSVPHFGYCSGRK